MPIVALNGGLASAVAASTQLEEKDKWLGELAQRVSAGGVKLVADEFRTSTDPYGDPWTPLKRWRKRDREAIRRKIRKNIRTGKGGKLRGPSVLVNTGRMRGSAGASPQGRIAKIVIPTWYARFHQDGTINHPFRHFRTKRLTAAQMAKEGTQRMPKRMMLPSDERGMPDKWNAMVERETSLFVAQKFGVRT